MDASTSSSSSAGIGGGGSSYPQTLIGTVAELRMELQRTMAEIHATKEQNRALQANNQAIKDELMETRKKYAESYENYMATVTEKLEAEAQNEAFMDRLKRQLAEKTKEFDLMRDKNSPQDIDTIRIKVQEELEIPHREKVMKINTELQEQKALSFRLKRDIEVARTEFDGAERSHRADLAALKVQHEQVERRMREEIIALQVRFFAWSGRVPRRLPPHPPSPFFPRPKNPWTGAGVPPGARRAHDARASSAAGRVEARGGAAARGGRGHAADARRRRARHGGAPSLPI